MTPAKKQFHPTSEQDVEAIVRSALADQMPLEILGRGTKRAIGCDVEAKGAVHMYPLSGILSYEPSELVISAWAGTPLREIEAILAAEGQHLAFEPPTYGHALGEATLGEATLGGAIASGFAGPRRIVSGSARDHILGLTGVTGRGETFKIGGRVVKNVTGYDLSKLIAGSFGTLAIMTRITLRVLPRPPVSRTLTLSDRTRNETLELLRKGAASPFGVSGAALLPGGAAHLRLEGRGDEISGRSGALLNHLGTEMNVLDDEASRDLWKGIGDLACFADETIVWRINLPRSKAGPLAERLEAEVGGKMMFDWAGARLWLAVPEDATQESVRDICAAAGGKAMMFKAPDAVKSRVPVFHPEPGPLAALTSRVRDAFDPERILNSGRMGMEGVRAD